MQRCRVLPGANDATWHRQVFGLQLPAWLPINPVGNVAINPANPLFLQSGGPGRTRTCNQTVMSGRL